MHHRLLGLLPPPLLHLDLGHQGGGVGVEGLGVRGVILVTVVTVVGVSQPIVTLAPGVDVEVDINVEVHSRLLIMVTLMMVRMMILRVH